jgi:hypothetical protein
MTNDQETIIDEANFNTPDELAANEALTPLAVPDPGSNSGVENCCVREFWAVVEYDGTLVRGRNVLNTRRLGPAGSGRYEVFFTGNVSNGVYVATIGRPGIGFEPTGQIRVALRSYPPFFFETDKGILVDTRDSNGSSSDRAFHLIVHTH